jgi:carotenoid 1,2-hydratase
LTLEIDEVAAPVPRRVRGRVTIHPLSVGTTTFTLDGRGRHRWHPIAPAARAEVVLDEPGIRWQGHAYVDSNEGDAPLEDDFAFWHWSRGATRAGPFVLYDVTRADGSRHAFALRFGADGSAHNFDPPPVGGLGPSRWRVPRATLADAGSSPRLLRRLGTGKFYARSSSSRSAARMRSVHRCH